MNQVIKIAIIFLLLAVGCKELNKENQNDDSTGNLTQENPMNTADTIVKEAIKVHGGTLYDSAAYQFTFREKKYSFDNRNGNLYTVSSKDSLGNTIVDILQGNSFVRTVNNNAVELSKKDVSKYSEALNSVIYFATLPHKLNDKAVIKESVGEAIIKGEDYDIIKVTFNKIGGGKDHDDVFMYWINKKSHYINYLAYSYSVNEGGVRFRSAYNPRTIDGIRFQDYINWEAPIGTPLKDLPAMFEKEQLKELSRIETEEVQNLNSGSSVE
ncbi:DUF6503 family protein [Maribacter hydrothermalis]|uniref:Deoxyribose-phosphate aldolase n=1 Tax=Maribacter hydrothermalis TaxID=1836467 RepID=A0A1B7ZET1_9FLAO|nr:DUF6503 family protein [Maribacter hydrothermalis]APQ17591.1 hypothetical protein BTR34_09730 [Maribacter hydrothermalis]OBR42066.1 hypothetical protein A9200_01360 [Maribacter hydrothermalis]